MARNANRRKQLTATSHGEPCGDGSYLFSLVRAGSGSDGTIRHFWSNEMGSSTADPGQDPRGAPDTGPLWTILDTTPEGRGKDWYPSLSC
jgi:predicted dithiol-disulfide oxidoreductase (DUF899 family)